MNAGSGALPPGGEALLDRYLAELALWGERFNLVGSVESQALSIHLSDSLAAAPHVPAGSRVVDLGSGAGFPGLPLAIARPDLTMVLVEGRERRVHFLRHVVRVLELPVEVRRTRIEDAPPERFDIALVRALAPLPRALELAIPWVRDGGEVWIWTRGAAPGALGEIPLGERGRILRLPAHAVPRGTS